VINIKAWFNKEHRLCWSCCCLTTAKERTRSHAD